jgi:hypothetical protein
MGIFKPSSNQLAAELVALNVEGTLGLQEGIIIRLQNGFVGWWDNLMRLCDP